MKAVPVPIILYHAVLEKEEGKGRYVVSPAELEADLMWLSLRGFHSVVLQDLLDYVFEDKTLPEKPVMLTFDDGFLNNLRYVLPLLQKYNMKMVFSPVGNDIDRACAKVVRDSPFASVTWDELTALQQSGLAEIQNHSYNLHRDTPERLGAQKRSDEGNEQYRTVLLEDLGKAQQELEKYTGFCPKGFVYPYGAVSEETVDILKEMGFLAAFTCEEKVNQITHDAELLYWLGRFVRAGDDKTEPFFAKVFAGKE